MSNQNDIGKTLAQKMFGSNHLKEEILFEEVTQEVVEETALEEDVVEEDDKNNGLNVQSQQTDDDLFVGHSKTGKRKEKRQRTNIEKNQLEKVGNEQDANKKRQRGKSIEKKELEKVETGQGGNKKRRRGNSIQKKELEKVETGQGGNKLFGRYVGTSLNELCPVGCERAKGQIQKILTEEKMKSLHSIA